MIDPMPRQDLQQPPRMPEAAEIARLTAELEAARTEAEFFKGEVKLRNRIPSTSDTNADLLRRAEKAEAERDAIAAAAFEAAAGEGNEFIIPTKVCVTQISDIRMGRHDAADKMQKRIRALATEPQRAALDRLIADRVAEAVKVKPLVWTETATTYWDHVTKEEKTAAKFWQAETMLMVGNYSIMRLVDERVSRDRDSYRIDIRGKEYRYLALEAAKAAAQTDYETRIRAALAADGEA